MKNYISRYFQLVSRSPILFLIQTLRFSHYFSTKKNSCTYIPTQMYVSLQRCIGQSALTHSQSCITYGNNACIQAHAVRYTMCVTQTTHSKIKLAMPGGSCTELMHYTCCGLRSLNMGKRCIYALAMWYTMRGTQQNQVVQWIIATRNCVGDFAEILKKN